MVSGASVCAVSVPGRSTTGIHGSARMKIKQRLSLGRLILAGVSVVLLGLVFWQALYHGPDEPKDLRYQAWKLGLYSMDLDKATSTMVGDIYPDRLVMGRTEAELAKRFGYVTGVENASEYVRYCYFNSPYYGKEALILRHSNWMVLMKNGRVLRLILVKGC